MRMIDTHKDAPAVVDVLPDWFARCYRECIRVDAKQVCVILVQDLQRLLPGQPVGHVYVPKLGYGCDQEHSLLEKATRMLHKSGFSKRRVLDMYSELNIEGRNIFQSTTIEEYTKLCDAQASRHQQERAVPQHLPCGTAHPHWLAFREEDPHNPAGPRPISSSDVLCILKHKDFTQAQRNVLLKYQQRQGLKQQFDAQTLLNVCGWD